MKDVWPSQMRLLIQHLNREVIKRARQEVKVAEDRRKYELDQLNATEQATEKELAGARQQLDTKLSQDRAEIQRQSGWVVQEAASVLNRSQPLLAGAHQHLKDNLINVPEYKQPQSFVSGLSPADSLAKAKSEVAWADDLLRRMQKLTVNGEVFAVKGLGWLALGVAYVLAIVLSYTVGGGVIGFFVWLVMGYGGIGLARLLYRRFDLSSLYSNLLRTLSNVEADLLHHLEQARADQAAHTQQATISYEANLRELQVQETQKKAAYKHQRETLHQRYYQALQKCEGSLAQMAEQAHALCQHFREMTKYIGACWDEPVWQDWAPATSPAFVASFGTLTPYTEDLKKVFPSLDLNFPIPALIPFADGKCLLLRSSGAATNQAAQCLQSVMLRLLATIPPGKVNFTLIDPVGLGNNVAAMMKLAEHEESLVRSRAWSEPQHIEQQLAELTEHMETIIQKRLRTDYASIEEYNEKAKVKETYRVLVVMDFPVNFNDTSIRRLISIAQNGPRCGVYTLIMMNTDKPRPHGFKLADLEQHSFVINHDGNSFIWDDPEFKSCHLLLDKPPADDIANSIIKQVGEKAKAAMKVEVSYTELLEESGLDRRSWWKKKTADKMEVPLGPTGAHRPQLLTLGEGLTHHGLIIGRTRSGKTNLMHVIITTLALAYPPQELQTYLIDFKKGVGFKPYADYKLPHAIAIAIESEREFGLSVLQGLNDKMQQRGEEFRRVSVENIGEYRRKLPEAEMPRLLLVADEFQEFFTHDDNISTQAAILLDRLTRQGAGFGIHILLGTQTLQGSRNMPRSILNQIAVRIALQCSEEDSRIVLSQDNPAARLLSRPGEAIYNAANGLIAGNNLFQVALFTDEDRSQHLQAIADLAGKSANEPIIFEGNEPAHPEAARAFNHLLARPTPAIKPKAVEAWLGEPTAIRDPVRARLRRQSGNNLLIVTREESEGMGMIFSTLLSLAAQHAPGQAQVHIVNLATADSDWFEWPGQLTEVLPNLIKIHPNKQVPALLKELLGEATRRTNEPSSNAPTIYLVIIGLQRARDLREEEFGYGAKDDGTNANKLFGSLLREGPETGIHTIVWCDSVANVNRVARRQMREFGLRVASLMSAEDSRTLLDDGAAAKLDKPHRAIFYDDERPGVFEKFRPYALPGFEWLQQTAARLRDRA